MFRGHTFVLGLDASVILHENFTNLLTDIAVLHSLQIRLVLVYGIGRRLKDLSEERNIPISDAFGFGPTDDATLQLAIEANGAVNNQLLARATQAGLRCEISNAVRPVAKGVVNGVDFAHTGRVSGVDTTYFRNRIEAGAIPVVAPLAYTRDGRPLRLNSDHTAADLAIRLQASKLIFLTRFQGLTLEQALQKNIPLEALQKALEGKAHDLDPSLRSKAEESCRALQSGVPRAHILDGTRFGGLLTEIFEKEGVGTMIHANEYEQIRPATPKDLNSIFNLTREGVRSDALRPRTRKSIEQDLERFFVYEIDDSLIACACLTPYPDAQVAELGTVYVHPFYQGRGIGSKMVEYATGEAREKGFHSLLALSTQNFSFFKNRADFSPGSPDDLPPARRQQFEAENRGGQILIKSLS
jgi:amino-acid N-acetyltransferase